MSCSLNWNRISKDSQASTNLPEIHPSQEISLWNSLHFYVDLKGSTPKSQEIFAKYFVSLLFWFCEKLFIFTWKDNRITWKAYKFASKANLNLKVTSENLWILRNTKIPIPVKRSTHNIKSMVQKKHFNEKSFIRLVINLKKAHKRSNESNK